MGKLYLHVGQDKTGSSFIQSFLAKNNQLIEKKGFYYPVNKSIESASVGKISGGNEPLYQTDFFRQLKDSNKSFNHLLFSGEKLFRRLPKELKKTTDYLCSNFNIESIECLLFIRNPIEHMQSAYQQAIKRGGYVDTIENFSSSYHHTKRVYEFIEFCSQTSTINLKILNYSNCKANLIDELLAWLDIDAQGFESIEKTINRSLTRSELEFQRLLNEKLGKKASFLSDAFCNKLPDIKSESVLISDVAKNNMLRNIEKYCVKINQYSSELNNGSDQYDLQVAPAFPTSDKYAFSVKQMEVIIDEVFDKLQLTL